MKTKYVYLNMNKDSTIHSFSDEIQATVAITAEHVWKSNESCFQNLHFEEGWEKHDITYGPNVEHIVTSARILAESVGFEVDSSTFTVEMHLAVVEGGKVESGFEWHMDSYTAVPGRSVTVLFYLQKDPGIQGGNLLWIPDRREDPEQRHEVFEVKNDTVAVMSGCMPHFPEPITGIGMRRLITVFLQRT